MGNSQKLNNMPREDKQHKIEVHVAGICLCDFEDRTKVLCGKRQLTRELYPNLWECGGGQVEEGENFEEAMVRHFREEFGVIVKAIAPMGVYEIPTPQYPQKKIPGLKFLCQLEGYINDQEPKIDQRQFSEWRWQTLDRLDELEFIPGIPRSVKEDILAAYQIYKNLKR